MSCRRGYSTIELLIALLLGALLSAAAYALLQSQSHLARSTSDYGESAEVLRTATQVLSAETRWLVPARDIRAITSDSLSLRAFRGSGVVCGLDSAYGALLAYSGPRDPDPTKDSALIERGANIEITAAVLGVIRGSGACDTVPALKISVSQPLATGDLLLIYESGNYYLSGGALRYRLGAEGRQPVTLDLLNDTRTLFMTAPGSWHVQLETNPRRGRGAAAARFRLPFQQP